MQKFIVEQSPYLKGTVKIGGSKNAVLPILAATLLTEEGCTIKNVPPLQDVFVMKDLLADLGLIAIWNEKEHVMHVQASDISKNEANYELASKIRASFLIMGPMLARKGYARVPLPGGCAIGTRPVELHLKGFTALGAEVNQDHGYIVAKTKGLRGNNIYLDFPSVGATENIMMAAVLAQGETTIENCAVEPEIVDLANFLVNLGAEITGIGTDTIKIKGVETLKGSEYTVMPDRIEAGTFMVAAAITEGDVIVENVIIDHLKPIVAKLKEANVGVEEVDSGIRVYKEKDLMLKGVDLKTMPYPGFPTDMQAQFLSLLSLASGVSVVTETIFENRFMHVRELKKMGADIKIDSRSALIEGVEELTGANVKATDLRAGASLILAALKAEGITEINDIYHIDRGYNLIDDKLRSLGAKITRVNLE